MKTKKKIFKVKIEEVYEKTVEVLAETVEDANEIISGADIIMENSNYKENSFRIVSTNETSETIDSITSKIITQTEKCSNFKEETLSNDEVSEIKVLFFLENRLKKLIGWKE